MQKQFENRKYTKDEIVQFGGKFDNDGFFILPDGDFFDSYGFYFDKSGRDSHGGFYDQKTGVYTKGEIALSTRSTQPSSKASKSAGICRDFMEKNCSRDNCRYSHDSNACFHFWKNGQCKFGDQCKKTHQQGDKENVAPNTRSKPSSKHASKGKNTQNFNPSYEPADMRIVVSTGLKKCNLSLTTRDIVLVPHIFSDEPKMYDKLLAEIMDSGVNEDKLWKSWHNDSHMIADDKQLRKDKSPVFSMVIDRIRDYFGMDIKATRFNWYRDCSEWKPFHHDAAAVKPDKAKTQNFTVGISFGCERDISFEENNSRRVVTFPQPDGMTYCFTKDININWKHGVPQLPPDQQKKEGRISIIAWGWLDQKQI